MDQILDLRKKIKAVTPLHDTSAGRIHPYWARKPLNVIREIIKSTTAEGDIVCDPFMGSGTIAIGSLLEHRNILASDISPLSYLITQGTLSLSEDPEAKNKSLTQFFERFQAKISPWFTYGSNKHVIDRERYIVEGEFENGKFRLIPHEVVLKQKVGSEFRRSETINNPDTKACVESGLKQFLDSPVDFNNHKLIANSRIAIPKGATLAHYFTCKNRASINYALHLIKTSKYDKQTKALITFLLSSSLPLLRLSDYKASSQWPYWRPKTRLTSRNPIFVFQRRMKEFKTAQTWLSENMPPFRFANLEDLLVKDHELKASINRMPIQGLIRYLPRLANSVDLVLTDPPYGDHVPYLEYSNFWAHTLGLKFSGLDYKREIVKTDAEGRVSENARYITKLVKSFEICAKLLKNDGYLVWFYQDNNIKNWASVYKKSVEMRLRFVDVIPLAKQRRSMKTVKNPGKTFDGDLIVIFRKSAKPLPRVVHNHEQYRQYFEDALVDIERDKLNFFYSYAEMIKRSLEHSWIENLSREYTNIKDCLGK